jgi:hypothetical protein
MTKIAWVVVILQAIDFDSSKVEAYKLLIPLLRPEERSRLADQIENLQRAFDKH